MANQRRLPIAWGTFGACVLAYLQSHTGTETKVMPDKEAWADGFSQVGVVTAAEENFEAPEA